MPAKIFQSPEEAVADVPDGARVAIAGFGLTQSFPCSLTTALRRQGAADLCIVANSLGQGPHRSMSLIENRQVSRLIVSFSARAGAGASPAEAQIASGDIEVELVPQGTLVERLRAAGSGIGGVFTRTGVGTQVAEGKETRTIDGVDYVLETALSVDYALIRASRADRFGNLSFRGVGRNFMPSFAKAARVAIAEVDEIVDELDPEEAGLPGIFVSRVVKQTGNVTAESVSNSRRESWAKPAVYNGKSGWSRNQVAEAAAALIPEHSYVNLGLGMPTLVSNYIRGRDIVLQGENGILGYGELAGEDDFDPAYYDAGSEYVRLLPGASFFESVTAFEMIRGGKVDVVMLGAFQVDAHGNLANWSTPAMVGGGIGGAMDLAAGGRTLVVLMTHCDREGRPKLVADCEYPLTGQNCVDIVVTDLGVFRRSGEGFKIEKLASGFDPAEVRALTDLELVYDANASCSS